MPGRAAIRGLIDRRREQPTDRLGWTAAVPDLPGA
jgi:hypothetical protein